MSLFAKLFGRSEPTAEMAAADLATHLFLMAMAVEDTWGIRTTDPNRSGFAMQEVLFTYLNLADRALFGLFGPETRDRAMHLLDESLPKSITAALCNNWPEELENAHVQKFVQNMKSAEADYGNLPLNDEADWHHFLMQCASKVLETILHLNDSAKARALAMARLQPGLFDSALEERLAIATIILNVHKEMPMLPHVRKLGDALSA